MMAMDDVDDDDKAAVCEYEYKRPKSDGGCGRCTEQMSKRERRKQQQCNAAMQGG
jgi:uncharacterized paraquat-inducible protein A